MPLHMEISLINVNSPHKRATEILLCLLLKEKSAQNNPNEKEAYFVWLVLPSFTWMHLNLLMRSSTEGHPN